MPDQPIREQVARILYERQQRSRLRARPGNWDGEPDGERWAWLAEADSLLARIDPDGKLNEAPRFTATRGSALYRATEALIACQEGRPTWATLGDESLDRRVPPGLEQIKEQG